MGLNPYGQPEENKMIKESTAVSTSEDAFAKGWNAGDAVEVKPSAEFVAVSEGQSTVSEPQVTQVQSAASSQASSPQATESASVAGSSVTESHAVSSVALSATDYEQKWKSSHGIIRANSVALSKAISENVQLRAQPAQAAVASQATSVSESTAVDPVDDLEDQYMEAVIDGKKSDALKIRKKIDKIKDDRFTESVRKNIAMEVDARTSERLTAGDEDRAIEIVKNAAYKDFPYLNNEGPAANSAAIRFVRATAAEYFQSGMSKSEALEEAVKDAAKIPWVAGVSAASVAQTAAVSTVDNNKLASMVAVDTKSAPIKTDQKAEGKGSYEAGWARPVPI